MTTRDILINVKPDQTTSPVAKCVQVASQFASKIYFEYETKKVNGKSIMGMMALGITPGNVVKVSADGSDEIAALDSIEAYLATR